MRARQSRRSSKCEHSVCNLPFGLLCCVLLFCCWLVVFHVVVMCSRSTNKRCSTVRVYVLCRYQVRAVARDPRQMVSDGQHSDFRQSARRVRQPVQAAAGRWLPCFVVARRHGSDRPRVHAARSASLCCCSFFLVVTSGLCCCSVPFASLKEHCTRYSQLIVVVLLMQISKRSCAR